MLCCKRKLFTIYLLSIADVLWQSGVIMENCSVNNKEYMNTLNFIREYFETYVTNEGLMNYGHSRDAYNFVEKLIEICPKLVDSGAAYKLLYEQPTYNIMNACFQELSHIYSNAMSYCNHFFTYSEMYVRLSRLIRMREITKCNEWITDMKNAKFFFDSDPRYQGYDTESSLSSLSDIE